MKLGDWVTVTKTHRECYFKTMCNAETFCFGIEGRGDGWQKLKLWDCVEVMWASILEAFNF